MNLHARLLKLGLDRHPITATKLLNAYVHLPSPNSITYARQVFDEIPSHYKDSILWTSMISAYAQSQHPIQALHLFSQMLRLPPDAPRPTHFTYASAARSVASIADLLLAQSLHAQIIKLGFLSNVIVNTSILTMYSKCNVMELARRLFDEMPHRNIVTWSSMIAGYASGGMGVLALQLFFRMRCVELELGTDEFTVASALTACSGLGDLISGTQIHGYLVTVGLEMDFAVKNALSNMYFRCGDVECAERAMEGIEESVMSGLMMIKGYVFNERYHEAIRVIHRGGNFAGIVMWDHSVIVSILTACANLEMPRIGRQVHGLTVTLGNFQNFHSSSTDDVVLGSALIDMYCKCSSVGEARQIFNNLLERHVSHWNAMIVGCIHNGFLEEARGYFDDMPERSMISWTAMMSGHVQYGLPQEGLRLLSRLYSDGMLIRGNCFAFSTALNACSGLAAMDKGKQIHAQAIRMTAESGINRVVVEAALIDMYSKSGNLNYAQKVFDRMEQKNIVSWTSMITGHAIHGLGSEAIKIFQQMLSMGLEPNEVTFVAVLSACSHCGLLEEGMHYFKSMRPKYGIAPTSDHYSCMVDMLGRAGKLSEAWNLVEEIKDAETNNDKESNVAKREGAAIWGALLGGCRLYGNVEMGSKVAMKMLERKHQSSDTYIALSNVYAAAEMWEKVYKVREESRSQGVVREPGHSQIHIGCHG